MSKRALLLHGTGSNSKGNWFPWLKSMLEKAGYEVWVPDLPSADRPNIARYNSHILSQDGFIFDENTVVVGHSSGAVAALGLLQALPEGTCIGACYLVGSFKDDLGWEKLKDLFDPALDFEKIRGKCEKFIFLHSDNDPHCPLEHAQYLHKQLGGELIVQPKQSHFSISTSGRKYKRFPFLRDLVVFEGMRGIVRKFLEQYQLMSVATYGEQLWIANMYYALDAEDFRLYFVSCEACRHSRDILKNPQVAVSVIDSTQTPVKRKKFTKTGLQMMAHARLLTDETEMMHALHAWKTTLKIEDKEYFTAENIAKKKIEARMWEIQPKRVKFFDEHLFEEDEVPEVEL